MFFLLFNNETLFVNPVPQNMSRQCTFLVSCIFQFPEYVRILLNKEYTNNILKYDKTFLKNILQEQKSVFYIPSACTFFHF